MAPKPHAVVLTHRAAFQELLVCWLRELKEFATVLAARDSSEVRAFARRRRGAVYLLDPGDPRDDAFALARTARRLDATICVGFIAEAAAEGWIRAALDLGADAFIGPSAGLDEYRRAIKSVLSGFKYYSPCASRLIGDLLAAADAPRRTLTRRELEVLLMVCGGRSSGEIGKALGLSSKTIDRHRARIMSTTGIRSATGLVRWACDHRFVVPSAPVR